MSRLSAGPLSTITRSQRATLAVAVVLTAATAAVELAPTPHLARFVMAGLALAALAGVVGEAVDALGERLGPSVTGLAQSTLGNLPELLVGFFALRQGLDGVVRSAMVGSVLGNILLVLGCAFAFGGGRRGTQRFAPEEPRLNATLLLLIVAALLVPTLASHLNTPAASHTDVLSYFCAGLLLVVYAASVGWSLARSSHQAWSPEEGTWPLRLTAMILVLASAGSAVVSDWFVGALEPAIRSLGLSQAFTGLVVVAIASNAVEHVVAIRFAWEGKADLTIATTLSSALQVALFLIPVLVLLSSGVGATPLTLVFPPLLIAALGLSASVVLAIVFDGEYTWVEGVALVGLYGIIACAFWWG